MERSPPKKLSALPRLLEALSVSLCGSLLFAC